MPETEGWQRQKRGANYAAPLLSEQDETVPDSHIGMYALFSNKKDPAVYMSEKQRQKIRSDTFLAVKKIYDKYGSPDYADFWNYNLDAINQLGLNKFANHAKIAPVCGIIECFEQKVKTKTNGKPRNIISFGINIKRLTDYLFELKRYKLGAGPFPAPPELPADQKKSEEAVMFGTARLGLGDGAGIPIAKNALYYQFVHWCTLNNVTRKQGALMALEYFIQGHPTEGLKDIEEYRVNTEFTKTLEAPTAIEDGERKMTVKIQAPIFSVAKGIIRRYNSDIANITKETLTFDGYVNNALHLINQHMPLKYRDPEAAAEQEKIQQMKESLEQSMENDDFDE